MCSILTAYSTDTRSFKNLFFIEIWHNLWKSMFIIANHGESLATDIKLLCILSSSLLKKILIFILTLHHVSVDPAVSNFKKNL